MLPTPGLAGRADADETLRSLLLAVGAGDRHAFRRLHDATSARLMGILVAMLGRRDVAEEVLQECYIKIWEKAAGFDPARGEPMAWLTTVTRNKAVDCIRARRPCDDAGTDGGQELELQADGQADPSQVAELADFMLRLQGSLSRLSPHMRTSVLLTHWSGYTQEESARLMRAPLGTVKSWVRRSVARLRVDLAVAC